MVEINNQLDSIVNSLEVTMEPSDIEKLDAVLVYVLEHYEYSNKLSNMSDAIELLEEEEAEDAQQSN